MPRFHPIGDAAITLLAVVALVFGALIPGPTTLKGFLVLYGIVMLGVQFSRMFLALFLLERRSTLFDPEPDPGEEVQPEETDWPAEVKARPEYENVTPLRRAA